MKLIILLVFGLIYAGTVQAQVGSSISADGTAPNTNAMLDVQSPATGDGKGLLIPRFTQAQRTSSSAALAGGLLDDSGNLRGGVAQGLIVYQTDDSQGLYFNTSTTATPSWSYLGDVAGLLASNVWAAAGSTTNYLPSNVWAFAGSTTNYLPRTGGTMSGTLNMGAQMVTNVSHIDFNGRHVSVGRGANGITYGAAVGYLADGHNYGAAMGDYAIGYDYGVAIGQTAKGYNYGVAVGRDANGSAEGVAVGYGARGTNSGAALGREANGSSSGAAVGYQANGRAGAAVGSQANGSSSGAAVGGLADGNTYGAAMGHHAKGTNYGVAVGRDANGNQFGVAIGYDANGYSYGAVVGHAANGSDFGVALGWSANGSKTNVAIGAYANAQGGTEQIAIGHNVTNDVPNSARIRGNLYLDGGLSVYTNGTFGSSGWGVKAFTIDHPLDPENKVLRHFCLEGPQVWNVYAGNAQLKNGQAVVQLPDYYSALNQVGSEIYSLTPIGEALVWIDGEVFDNYFVIAGKRDIKVSWTIKVLRNDPGCLEDLRRRPVEQLKSELPSGQ